MPARPSSPEEFHEFSDEAMDWARTARSDQERAIFLQMARTWLEAAIVLERELDIVDKHPKMSEPATPSA